MQKHSGFTLIELLVVVAIIAILASVVIASMSASRQKGIRTAVQANLVDARSQAELFHLTNQTYTGLCGAAAVGGVKSILPFITEAASRAQATPVATDPAAAQGVNQSICWGQGDGWIASVPVSSGQYFCVDGNNAGRIVSSTIPADTYVCP